MGYNSKCLLGFKLRLKPGAVDKEWRHLKGQTELSGRSLLQQVSRRLLLALNLTLSQYMEHDASIQLLTLKVYNSNICFQFDPRSCFL